MKTAGPPYTTPIWVKRLFMAIGLIASLIGIVFVPSLSFVLVKAIFDTMIPETSAGTALGLVSGLIVFIGYLGLFIATDVFGLALSKHWK